jgi:hypothetical protein
MFKIINTFEKPNTEIGSILYNSADAQTIVTVCIVQNDIPINCSFYESVDGSYMENHNIFNSEEDYNSWYEIYGPLHDELTASFKTYITSQGVTMKCYASSTLPNYPVPIQPLEDYTPAKPIHQMNHDSVVPLNKKFD